MFEPGEVRSQHEFYDYEAKYVDGLASVPTGRRRPRPGRPPQGAVTDRLPSRGRAGLARVDFLVPRDETYISEMNTLPGFTATSMYPKQAELAGLRFDELIARLIELALERDR